MNYLDIILVIPIIWLGYRGFVHGLIIELATLVALVLGIYAGFHFSGYAATFLTEHFSMNEKYVSLVAFILTFIVVVVIVYLIGKLLEKVVNMIALGFVNKLAGGIFGVIKAAVILSVIIYMVNLFDINQKIVTEKSKEGSFLYKPVEAIVPFILPKVDLEKFKKSLPSEEEEDVVA